MGGVGVGEEGMGLGVGVGGVVISDLDELLGQTPPLPVCTSP